MEPPNENIQRSVAIYNLLQKADSTILNDLYWEDRSVISIALKNLIQPSIDFIQPSIEPITEAQFNHVCQSLKSHSTSLGYMDRMWNATQNYFQFQASLSMIIGQKDTIKKYLESAHPRLDEISVERSKLKERLIYLSAEHEALKNLNENASILYSEVTLYDAAVEALEMIKQLRDEGIAKGEILLPPVPLDEDGVEKVNFKQSNYRSEVNNRREIRELNLANTAVKAFETIKQQIRDEGITTVANREILLLSLPLTAVDLAKVNAYIEKKMLKISNEQIYLLQESAIVKEKLKGLDEEQTQLEKKLQLGLDEEDEIHM